MGVVWVLLTFCFANGMGVVWVLVWVYCFLT